MARGMICYFTGYNEMSGLNLKKIACQFTFILNFQVWGSECVKQRLYNAVMGCFHFSLQEKKCLKLKISSATHRLTAVICSFVHTL